MPQTDKSVAIPMTFCYISYGALQVLLYSLLLTYLLTYLYYILVKPEQWFLVNISAKFQLNEICR